MSTFNHRSPKIYVQYLRYNRCTISQAMLLSTYGSNDGHLNGDPSTPLMSYHNSVVGYTWLIALLGSLAFVLVLVSAVMLYYRKSHFTSSLIKGGRGNGGVNLYPRSKGHFLQATFRSRGPIRGINKRCRGLYVFKTSFRFKFFNNVFWYKTNLLSRIFHNQA